MIPKVGEVHRGLVGMKDLQPIYRDARIVRIKKVRRRRALLPLYKVTCDDDTSFFHLGYKRKGRDSIS